MNRKLSFGAAVALMIVAAALTYTITSVVIYNKFNDRLADLTVMQEKYEKLAKVDDIVRSNYVHDIDEAQLQESIIDGYMNGISDKYGMYFDEKQFKEFTQSNAGQSQGIGVNIAYDQELDGIRIINVMSESPAEKSGVQNGDVIVRVGDESVSELGYYVAVSKLQGESGTTAQFTVVRRVSDNGKIEPKEIEFNILRAAFESQSVFPRMMENGIGYIKITEFNRKTPLEFENSLKMLQGYGAVGLLFDVRYNPGGDLSAICSVLDQLLPEGPIVRIVDKSGTEKVYNSKSGEVLLPMAVLINENTYSAAELFASALKDYEKATLVGETTYGKGTVQTIIPLGDGSALDLSTHMYCPPFSDNFEGVGVTPHVEVVMPEELKLKFYALDDKQDPQIAAASKILLSGNSENNN